jgi:argonaute-like protein implicated in RNA metabolism and viral defense
MTTEKLVFSKLFPKTELGTHEVELATIYDNLKGTLAEANKEVIKALELKNQAAKLADVSLKKNRELIKELDKAEKLIKDLGLDSELVKVQKAKSEVSGNINAIDNIINRLLSV